MKLNLFAGITCLMCVPGCGFYDEKEPHCKQNCDNQGPKDVSSLTGLPEPRKASEFNYEVWEWINKVSVRPVSNDDVANLIAILPMQIIGNLRNVSYSVFSAPFVEKKQTVKECLNKELNTMVDLAGTGVSHQAAIGYCIPKSPKLYDYNSSLQHPVSYEEGLEFYYQSNLLQGNKSYTVSQVLNLYPFLKMPARIDELSVDVYSFWGNSGSNENYNLIENSTKKKQYKKMYRVDYFNGIYLGASNLQPFTIQYNQGATTGRLELDGVIGYFYNKSVTLLGGDVESEPISSGNFLKWELDKFTMQGKAVTPESLLEIPPETQLSGGFTLFAANHIFTYTATGKNCTVLVNWTQEGGTTQSLGEVDLCLAKQGEVQNF